MAHFNSTGSCRVLLVYPRFSAATFWNFTVACELVGARYPAAPLGLITLAAMLPQIGISGSSTATPRNSPRPTSTGRTS